MTITSVKASLQHFQENRFLDLDFLPVESSVYDGDQSLCKMDIGIHWRRLIDFMAYQEDSSEELLKAQKKRSFVPTQRNGAENKNEIHVFYDSIEPEDVREACKQSVLSNQYFMSALIILAQRPPLIERLFVTKDYIKEGVYRIKICKGGEWLEITIDDYFPCEPNGGPIFSSPTSNEIWVMLLEKAYAKVHGSYFASQNGNVAEALRDLTGFPTSCYDFKD